MNRVALSLALAASLAACATTGALTRPTPIDRAHAALDSAQAAYDRARLFADVLAPLLPVQYQQQLAAAETRAEAALAAAHAALTLAEQLIALRQAEAAVNDIAAITGAK